MVAAHLAVHGGDAGGAAQAERREEAVLDQVPGLLGGEQIGNRDHPHPAVQVAQDGALRAVRDARGDRHAVGVGDAAHLPHLRRRPRVVLGVEAHVIQPTAPGQLHQLPGRLSERQPERLLTAPHALQNLVGNHSCPPFIQPPPTLSTATRRPGAFRQCGSGQAALSWVWSDSGVGDEGSRLS